MASDATTLKKRFLGAFGMERRVNATFAEIETSLCYLPIVSSHYLFAEWDAHSQMWKHVLRTSLMNAIQCAAFLSGFLRQQVLLADEKLKADQKNILIDGFLLSAKVHQAAAEAIAKSFQDLSVSISAFPEKVWALPDEVDESNTVKKDFIIRRLPFTNSKAHNTRGQTDSDGIAPRLISQECRSLAQLMGLQADPWRDITRSLEQLCGTYNVARTVAGAPASIVAIVTGSEPILKELIECLEGYGLGDLDGRARRRLSQ